MKKLKNTGSAQLWTLNVIRTGQSGFLRNSSLAKDFTSKSSARKRKIQDHIVHKTGFHVSAAILRRDETTKLRRLIYYLYRHYYRKLNKSDQEDG